MKRRSGESMIRRWYIQRGCCMHGSVGGLGGSSCRGQGSFECCMHQQSASETHPVDIESAVKTQRRISSGESLITEGIGSVAGASSPHPLPYSTLSITHLRSRELLRLDTEGPCNWKGVRTQPEPISTPPWSIHCVLRVGMIFISRATERKRAGRQSLTRPNIEFCCT
jgi:hypothetical protein